MIAVLTAIAGRISGASDSVVSGAPLEPAQGNSEGGYLGSAAVLSTAPSLMARHQADTDTVAGPATAAPQAAPAPTPEVTPTAEPQPAFVTYTIQPGDTVSSIAASFGIDQKYILWNNTEVSADPDLLVVGAKLLIPSVNGIVYHVALGDTLTGIASVYQIDVQNIVGFVPNGVSSPDSVSEGMVLVLPGAVPPPLPIPAAVSAVGNADTGGSSGDVAVPAGNSLPPSSMGFIWPFHGPISSPFGEPRGGGYHKGMDIDGFNNIGASIVAAAAGTVVLAAWDDYGLGNNVQIQHADGSRTVYGHLSAISVTQGETVAQGQVIGALGCTGYCTGPHLHFELHIGGVPVDPLPYLP